MTLEIETLALIPKVFVEGLNGLPGGGIRIRPVESFRGYATIVVQIPENLSDWNHIRVTATNRSSVAVREMDVPQMSASLKNAR